MGLCLATVSYTNHVVVRQNGVDSYLPYPNPDHLTLNQVSKVVAKGARFDGVKCGGPALADVLYIEQYIETNFSKPFCVSHLPFYFNCNNLQHVFWFI